MKIKHVDIKPHNKTPFENCGFGREKYATILTKIVDSYAEGFVLAINNKWGTGKTTFVKMWEQSLKNEGFRTLYFNAWENDFDSSPLIPLIHEFKSLRKSDNKEAFNGLLKKGAVLAKNILPALVKAYAEKHFDSKTLADFLENSTKASSEIFENEITQYAAKKQGLVDFKLELEKYIDNEKDAKPVIFIIDELDRCRPNYAVEVLEQIKHFFNVKGIVFVLSIDKEQLGNAIKGVYGSDRINSDDYLRRFIDLEYRIPEPLPSEACNYFYTYFQFDDYFLSTSRQSFPVFKNEKKDFLEFASILFKSEKLTLRHEEKLFVHTRLTLRSFNHNQYIFPTLLFLLVFWRDVEPEFFKMISLRQFKLQEFVTEIESRFFIKVLPNNARSFLFLEALLIQFYYNFYKDLEYNLKLTTKSNNGEAELLNINISPSIDRNELLNFIVSFKREHFESIGLDYFLNKINLLENITI